MGSPSTLSLFSSNSSLMVIYTGLHSGASLISFKADYITYEYNTFMAYGGIQYMTYNYDDAEWAEFVAENAVAGELNYK